MATFAASGALPVIAAVSEFQRRLVVLMPNLRAFSRILCSGRAIAEDMAQEALAKAWRSRDSFEPGTNLKAWLFTIMRNEFYSYGRRAWREAHWDEEKGENIAAPPSGQYWALELSDAARALRDLPAGQRDALILVGAGGFSYGETAEICGTPVGTIKSRVARARGTLLEALDGTVPLPVRNPAGGPAGAEEILARLAVLTPAGMARIACD